MAEHLNQKVEPAPDAMSAMGKPIGPNARSRAYEHCKAMGLIGSLAYLCVNAVADQLERDRPYEAQAAGMKYLDLTGVYRLFAVLLTAAAAESAASEQGEG